MFLRSSAISLLAALVLQTGAIADEPPLIFNRDIRPILSDNCFHCHGADAAQRQAELRLDVRESAIEMGALSPGRVDESALVERITSDDPDQKMPPPDSKRRLTAEQIDKLTRWIAEGAEYQPHWAFQPVRRPELPRIERGDWPENNVDRFVLARLEEEDLAPSMRAPLPTLLRRISFDLTGLPPTPSQLAAWQAAADPVAAAVDELLASPHYGERMAVDWLDVARYADTHGFNNDTLRTMWRWRDWVVDAFNANMPYDRFITTQLAGDLLPDATLDDRIATGFNRNHVINSEGGIIDEEYRVEYVADRVRTTSLAWLGLTLECARCHDHKFDPLPQRDFYQMFAFFNNVEEIGESGRYGNASPVIRAPTKDQQDRYRELLGAEGALRSRLDDLAAEAPGAAAVDGLNDRVPGAEDQSLWNSLESRTTLRYGDDVQQFPTPEPVDAVAKATRLIDGWALMAWVQPDSGGMGPILSTMNFSPPPSSGEHGRGMQVRLTDEGAVEVRVSMRWPAYSTTVVSLPTIPAERWSHLAVVVRGRRADGVRIFLDSEEVESRIRFDDQSGVFDVNGTVSIGRSSEDGDSRFAGKLQRLRLIAGVLEEDELAKLLAAESPHRAPTTPEYLALLDDWRSARRERLAFQRSFPLLMVMQETPEPRPTFLLDRGLYDKPGEQVSPDVPAALGLPLPEGPRDRLALARWFTDRQHPLTARVVVNRLWHGLFATGLVKTVEDFGAQGEWPSHPELLDWLAAEFMESDWDVKHLVRLIIESSTYQQDSSATAKQWAADPENRLLARGPRQRLTAEMIRDQALGVSGLLMPRLGGPPVFPYQPAGLYENMIPQADYPGTTYAESTGDDLYRRSVYTFWKRTVPHPTLSTFDSPDREFCTARRSITNTPLQAMVLMNDPAYLEAARKLAARMLAEGGDVDEQRLAWGFELLTARRPDAAELATLVRLLELQRREFAAAAPAGLLKAGASTANEAVPPAELAAYASVASMLLNLDEAITRN
ncbi:MAG: DUF1553 domain-containing protein [Pirellulales bacterium]|nr:DUF1553 domain-containing protein [Pirellulales bacterium]